MSNTFVKLIGWKATVLHGDTGVYDRWKWLRRHLMPGKVSTLDAGCGSGAFTMYAAQVGNDAVGLSFDERNNQVAKTRAKILHLDNVQFRTLDLRELDKYGAELGKFDQIICLETIEHIWNDEKLIRDLASLLKPGGRLFLTTPFKGYHHLVGDTLSPVEDGGHVRWGYTHAEIGKLCRANGLDIVAEEFVTGWISQQLMNLLRLLTKLNYVVAWTIIFPLRLFQPLDPFITRLLGYPYLSIGVVAMNGTIE
ncbi:methyltransferase domain-containing protein [Anaerolineae bacterium CFX7]|nr:methyltransferase domain-containing protein [Anaerolineae bacterium CFX7]